MKQQLVNDPLLQLSDKIKNKIKIATGHMQNAESEKEFVFWSSRRQALLSVLFDMEDN